MFINVFTTKILISYRSALSMHTLSERIISKHMRIDCPQFVNVQAFLKRS